MADLIIDYRKNGHVITAERSSRTIVAYVSGKGIARTKSAILLKESGHSPVFYVPFSDVHRDALTDSSTTTVCPYKGTASYYNIKTEDGFYQDAIWRYKNPKPEFEKIRDFVAFYSDVAEVTED